MTSLDSAHQIRATLQTLRRDLHAHPELAFAETRTANIVAAQLDAWGIETCRGLGRTGVVGTLRAGGGGRAIGLRADMDALPIAESNRFAHRSLHDGCMHACGHEGHVVMLLGAAKLLADARDFDGTVHLIFQPGEEGAGGARAMIEDGLFERFPMDAIYGLHNWPGLPAGHFAVHAGPVMAGTDRFDIHIEGVGGHAAMPHLSADPILAGAALVQAVQSIVSRTLDPLDAAVVSITCFHAGDTFNVLPGRAKLSGTLRSFSAAVRDKALDRLRGLCAGTGEAFGVRIAFDLHPGGYPPTLNTAAEAAHCAEAAAVVAGREKIHTDARPSMGAEDFAFYLRHKPGAYIWLGNGPIVPADCERAGNERPGSVALHNAAYDFNDHLLPIGAAWWGELVRRCLPRRGGVEHP
ncbi:MAG: amidohydrolase [Azoarcus sp.]|jgi:hippurate hydrolase|nr:amidohydrolase [Azoarcus sp.]